jgi:hypothetical protein
VVGQRLAALRMSSGLGGRAASMELGSRGPESGSHPAVLGDRSATRSPQRGRSPPSFSPSWAMGAPTQRRCGGPRSHVSPRSHPALPQRQGNERRAVSTAALKAPSLNAQSAAAVNVALRKTHACAPFEAPVTSAELATLSWTRSVHGENAPRRTRGRSDERPALLLGHEEKLKGSKAMSTGASDVGGAWIDASTNRPSCATCSRPSTSRRQPPQAMRDACRDAAQRKPGGDWGRGRTSSHRERHERERPTR